MQKAQESRHCKIFSSLKTVLYLFLLLIALRITYYALSDGFCLQRIENPFSKGIYELSKPTEEELLELKNVCTNSFTYLGKGSQAYAFQSQDGAYVLKLFKCYHLKPVTWLEEMQLFGFLEDYKKSQLERRSKKTNHTLKSYQLAHDLIAEECGLIFLQIVPSSYFHQEVQITDKIGRTHTIDLAKHGFILQKKGDLLFPKFEHWIKEKKLKKAKKLIQSLVSLIVSRSVKGVQDQDPDLHKNAGCIGTQALFIDVGGFHFKEEAKKPEVYVHDVRKITNKLAVWLKDKSPELANFLDETIAQIDLQAELKTNMACQETN